MVLSCGQSVRRGERRRARQEAYITTRNRLVAWESPPSFVRCSRLWEPGSHPPNCSLGFHLVNSPPPGESWRYYNTTKNRASLCILCLCVPEATLLSAGQPFNQCRQRSASRLSITQTRWQRQLLAVLASYRRCGDDGHARPTVLPARCAVPPARPRRPSGPAPNKVAPGGRGASLAAGCAPCATDRIPEYAAQR